MAATDPSQSTTGQPRSYRVVLREYEAKDFRERLGRVTCSFVNKKSKHMDVIMLSPQDDSPELWTEIIRCVCGRYDYTDVAKVRALLFTVSVRADGNVISLDFQTRNMRALLNWLRQTDGSLEIGFTQQITPSLEEIRKSGGIWNHPADETTELETSLEDERRAWDHPIHETAYSTTRDSLGYEVEDILEYEAGYLEGRGMDSLAWLKDEGWEIASGGSDETPAGDEASVEWEIEYESGPDRRS